MPEISECEAIIASVHTDTGPNFNISRRFATKCPIRTQYRWVSLLCICCLRIELVEIFILCISNIYATHTNAPQPKYTPTTEECIESASRKTTIKCWQSGIEFSCCCSLSVVHSSGLAVVSFSALASLCAPNRVDMDMDMCVVLGADHGFSFGWFVCLLFRLLACVYVYVFACASTTQCVFIHTIFYVLSTILYACFLYSAERAGKKHGGGDELIFLFSLFMLAIRVGSCSDRNPFTWIIIIFRGHRRFEATEFAHLTFGSVDFTFHSSLLLCHFRFVAFQPR